MIINIAGKEVRLFFGMHVFQELNEYVMKKGDMSHIGFMAILITAAHENFCLTDRVPLPYQVTYQEVRMHIEEMVLDEAFTNELLSVTKAYENSVPKRMVDKINESNTEVKKKVTAKPNGKK